MLKSIKAFLQENAISDVFAVQYEILDAKQSFGAKRQFSLRKRGFRSMVFQVVSLISFNAMFSEQRQIAMNVGTSNSSSTCARSTMIEFT